jgi:hypothetical protein
LITLQDMVTNGSVSPEGAELLRGIGAAGRSFLVYALPRNAGKSTLTEAILAEAPADLPRHDFYGTEQEVDGLTAPSARGYVVVGEIGHRGRPGYLAGEEEVGRVFSLVAAGYSLASSLHADSVDEVFEVLARNGVDRQAAAGIPYFVKVRVFGDASDSTAPRAVEQIHEITADGDSAMRYERTGARLA